MHIHDISSSCNLYAAEFMQYAFHFAEASVKHQLKTYPHDLEVTYAHQFAGLRICSKSALVPACHGRCTKADAGACAGLH